MQINLVPNQLSPVNYDTNIIIIAGETVAQGVPIAQLNGTVSTPINLTGYTAKMLINASTPLLLNTQNAGLTIPTPTNGIVIINITSAQSVALTPGSYSYDLFIVSASGVETAILAGTFTVALNNSPVP